MIAPNPSIEITKTPIALNSIPSKEDTKEIIFGKNVIEIKKAPISIHINEYIGSRFFFLTNSKIIKIIITPIKNAISLECKDIMVLFFMFKVY
tara:strand:+ start:358 stop:636 length:279 start_codon:yes stop_codon:yes gene_type:complete